MPAADEAKFLQAAAECVDLARVTKHANTRRLNGTRQQWPDLAQDRSDKGAFLAALEAFNDWRMQKKTKQ